MYSKCKQVPGSHILNNKQNPGFAHQSIKSIPNKRVCLYVELETGLSLGRSSKSQEMLPHSHHFHSLDLSEPTLQPKVPGHPELTLPSLRWLLMTKWTTIQPIRFKQALSPINQINLHSLHRFLFGAQPPCGKIHPTKNKPIPSK